MSFQKVPIAKLFEIAKNRNLQTDIQSFSCGVWLFLSSKKTAALSVWSKVF